MISSKKLRAYEFLRGLYPKNPLTPVEVKRILDAASEDALEDLADEESIISKNKDVIRWMGENWRRDFLIPYFHVYKHTNNEMGLCNTMDEANYHIGRRKKRTPEEIRIFLNQRIGATV